MKCRIRALSTSVILAVALIAQASAACADSQFARVLDDPQGKAQSLQMAIVRYRSPGRSPELDGVTVDLVSAVHIGDATYYRELNSRFLDYDVLLYELIAPPGTQVPAADEMPDSFVSNTQMAMRTALGLAYQLEVIDYGASNFVHADLSPDELSAHMQARGESLYVYFWRAFYAGMREASRDPLGLGDIELLASLLKPGPNDDFKVVMARELANFDTVTSMLDGPDGSALISSRNQRAIDVLQRELRAGALRVGIFYGVAHMPDLERRLADQLGLQPVETQWLDAWSLDDATLDSTP